MELKRDETVEVDIESVSVFAPAPGRRVFLISVIVALYAVATYHCINTSGESKELALDRIRRKNRENFKNQTNSSTTTLTTLPDAPLPMDWAPAPWAGVLMGVVISVHLLFHLMCYWRPSFLAASLFKPARQVRHGYRALATPPKHRGSIALVEIRRSELTDLCGFEFQRQRYEIKSEGGDEDDEEESVHKVKCPVDKPLSEYVKNCGLKEDNVELLTDQYGKNMLTVQTPSFLTLYKEQILSPLVIFQLFLSFLWAMDDYISYTLMQVFFILMLESTTVFQRQRTMKMLNGMTVKPFDVKVYREGGWIEISTNDLLPGDLMQLVVEKPEAVAAVATEAAGKDAAKPPAPADANAGVSVVPCDCLLLRGEAIVNEASLTGESVPQMKEALLLEDMTRPLEMEGVDIIHMLSSGTSPMSTKAGDVAEAGPAARLPETPDGGCLCYVLRTGFNSSQGKLLQMIEFSTDRHAVKADEREMSIALLVLLGFALVASSYVMKKGLEKGDKTLYELVLKCVIIISSVVPRSLPMTMAVAVNTALMTLVRAGVFCTEPHRVPIAGKLTHCLFDKTGTITTDTLVLEGIVNSTPAGASDQDAEKHSLELVPVQGSSPSAAMILGACHSIVEVGGKLVGDPIELSALRSVSWSFDAAKLIARPCEAEAKRQAVAAAKAELQKVEDRFKLMAQGGHLGPVQPKPEDEKEKTDKQQLVKTAEEALEEAERKDLQKPLESVEILQRYRFLSKLQRSCTVVKVTTREAMSSDIESGRYALVKGSPEAIGKLLSAGAAPSWYESRYRDLAEEGKRVLALALKKLPDDADEEVPTREKSERDLTFAGFIAFSCMARADSELVISSLRESAHTVALITGDSPLTALHVARQTGFCAKHSVALVLQVGESGEVSWAVATGEKRGENRPFNAAALQALVEGEGFELMTTEASLRVAVDVDPELWNHLEHIRVFARMSPQGKADVIRSLQNVGTKVFMCGDGGNDMGALKQADVGLALMSGYGNTNVGDAEEAEKSEAKEKSDAASTLALPPDNSSSEDKLNQGEKNLQKRTRELQKEKQRLLAKKQNELQLKQKQWLDEEMAKRAANGQDTGGVMANVAAMKTVMSRFTSELIAERKELDKRFGNAYEKKKDDPLSQLMGEAGDPDSAAAAGGVPMIRPGDASLAAAFTSRVPSIKSTVDLIRQGRCALLSALQQQQITMLHCLISAYVLSALSLEGSRSSERQMMASSWLLSTASIAFSYARPTNKMHPVRPLKSLFHPAIFVSLFGQAAIHLGCLVYATNMARTAMDPESEVRKDGQKVGPSLDDITEFWKKQKLIRQGVIEKEVPDEELGMMELVMKQWESPFLPNLMNTVVFLVETSQTVAVLAVNYKGQPWMKGLVENRPLFLSVFVLVGAMAACAWEVVPYANELIHLTPFPGQEFRVQIMILVLISIFGTFIWDRLCVWWFAPEIFQAIVQTAMKTKFEDDVLPIFVDTGKILLGFILFSAGIPGWIGLFIWYRNRKKEE